MKVKLKKISESALPNFKAASWDSFIVGQGNEGVSLPIAYELTGKIIGGLEIGKSLSIDRDTRNGVKCLGIFYSTTIKDITEKEFYKIIETENSVYLLEDLG